MAHGHRLHGARLAHGVLAQRRIHDPAARYYRAHRQSRRQGGSAALPRRSRQRGPHHGAGRRRVYGRGRPRAYSAGRRQDLRQALQAQVGQAQRLQGHQEHVRDAGNLDLRQDAHQVRRLRLHCLRRRAGHDGGRHGVGGLVDGLHPAHHLRRRDDRAARHRDGRSRHRRGGLRHGALSGREVAAHEQGLDQARIQAARR